MLSHHTQSSSPRRRGSIITERGNAAKDRSTISLKSIIQGVWVPAFPGRGGEIVRGVNKWTT